MRIFSLTSMNVVENIIGVSPHTENSSLQYCIENSSQSVDVSMFVNS